MFKYLKKNAKERAGGENLFMENNKHSEGAFSVEYIFQQVFKRSKVLSVELKSPVKFKNKLVSTLCISGIEEDVENKEKILSRILNAENTDGTIKVKVYYDDPYDCEIITLDNMNILELDL